MASVKPSQNVHDRRELADIAPHPVFVADRIRQRLPGQRLAAETRRAGADNQVFPRSVEESHHDLHHAGFGVRQRHASSRAVVGA